MGSQCVDEFIELTFHYKIQLVNGQTDPVIRHTVLLEVVRADLLGSIAAADHRFAFARLRVVLLLFLKLLEASSQDPHRFLAILDLRFFILHRDDNARGHVRDPHCGVRRIYRLPAGPG
jgi:hypothetical protein